MYKVLVLSQSPTPPCLDSRLQSLRIAILHLAICFLLLQLCFSAVNALHRTTPVCCEGAYRIMASQAALSSLQAASPSGFAFRKSVGGDQISACPQVGLAPIRAATKVIPKKIAPSKKVSGTQKIGSGTQKIGSGTQIKQSVKNAASAAANGAASLPRKAVRSPSLSSSTHVTFV